MTEKTLELLREVVEARTEEAKKQHHECEKEVIKTLENIIGIDNVKVTGVGDNYDSWVAYVEVIDDKGERVFGTEFRVYYYKGLWNKKGVELNYGTCGSFDKNNTPQIKKVLAMAKVLEHLDEVEECFANLQTDKMEALDEARNEVANARSELKNKYRKEIEGTLAVGNEYDDGDTRITKITPKYVTYEYTKGVWAGKEEKERKEDFVRNQANKRMKLLDEQ